MQQQIAAIRPKAIVCLGRNAPVLLVHLVKECDPWTKAKTFKEIDRNDAALVEVFSVPDITVAAILLDPSFRRLNKRHRSYRRECGHNAEIALLKTVWSRVQNRPRTAE